MRLGEHLKQNGIKLTDFAASIGEKVTTVHGWISGRRNPGLAALVAIERVTSGAVRTTDFVPAPTPAPASAPEPSANTNGEPKRRARKVA